MAPPANTRPCPCGCGRTLTPDHLLTIECALDLAMWTAILHHADPGHTLIAAADQLADQLLHDGHQSQPSADPDAVRVLFQQVHDATGTTRLSLLRRRHPGTAP